MPFGFRLGDLIIYFVLALLIFGPHKLPEIGAAIGKTVSAFKHGIKGAATDESIEVDQAAALIEQRNLEIRRLELQALERAIASKKATLRAYEAASVVEGSSEQTDTEIQAN